jgi:very-short-patch-repair endonuclease
LTHSIAIRSVCKPETKWDFPSLLRRGRGRWGRTAMNQFFNREDQTPKRRQLRNSMPDAEVILRSRLKARQMLGCKFRRQYGVGAFVLDFYAPQLKLGIELDGDSHFQEGAREYDQQREDYIKSFGIKVLRFVNSQIRENLDGVLEAIRSEVIARRGARR